MTQQRKKLVLFDIDGTLIRNAGTAETLGRFPYALKSVFGIDIEVSKKNWKYHGFVDRGILWDLAQSKGVTRKDFLEKFPILVEKFQEYFDTLDLHEPMYEIIDGARSLFNALRVKEHVHVGVLTGNLQPAAIWKLAHVGLSSDIPFGLYGHETDERTGLAKLVFARAKEYFGYEFNPEDVVIIGDTVNDIICGKAIDAITIAVTTGWNADRAALEAQKPDFLVDSLMDKSVRDFFGV